MKLKTLLASAAIALMTAACAESGYGPKQTVGGLGGAAVGGLIGAQFGSGSGEVAAAPAGVLIGALIGSEIGRQLDEADRIRANEAINRAHSAQIGQTITWNNPQTGNYGTVTPTREGTSSTGAYCREFQQTIVVGGKSEQGYGTACRQPDGSWQIVK